ncbi:hypothetical protein [Enterococcus cecorum]|uniref:hypothetical protein n=1 Tax=Enterococcus cecorum TaxID=44008 RepID=UPI00148E8842|nr:hypothetical protein [Enterococcus cecorum]
MGLFGKLFGKKDENQEVVVSAVNLNPGEVAAVVSGEAVALSTVNDPVFRLVAGELLGTFDRNAISKDGYDTTVMLIVTNTDNYAEVAPVKTGEVAAKEVILNVK